MKVNSVVEAVVNKIRRQLFDMQAAGRSSDSREDVTVEGVAPSNYLEHFSWNEAKYPPRRALKETVDTITETIQKLEDDLKVSLPDPEYWFVGGRAHGKYPFLLLASKLACVHRCA